MMVVFIAAAGLLGGTKAHATDDDYDAMRIRWKNYLTGGTTLDTSDPDIANKLSSINQTNWSTLNKTPAYLWSDLAATGNTAQITANYQRIKGMALAYSTNGSSLYGNQDLKADIIHAMDWMYANRYNELTVPIENWWDLEIGTPLLINDIVVLMYDDLIATPEKITNYMNAIEKFSPNPSKVNKDQYVPTGANLVWKCQVVALRGVILKAEAKLTSARDALSPVFDDVTSGDGFYADGSFIQHNVYAYTGSYGVSLLQELTNLLLLLNGSPWQPIYPGTANVYKWIYDAYEPLVYNGAMMDMTRGRAISRNYEQDHTVGHNVMASIIRLSQSAPAADALRMKAMVKAWILADSQFNFYKDANLSTTVMAKAIMSDSSITPRAEKVGSKVYAGMDQVVHLRPGFGFGVSMSSHRIGTYEATNGENLKGWYTSVGMTYLYNKDPLQFTDYWATVNKYRLPGTTVDTMPRADEDGAGYRSPATWAGGTELQGQYASAGMELKGYGSTLKAKKSWFMFDDEVVALGTGITSTDNRTIETTIENRMLTTARVTHGIDLPSPPSTPIGSEPLRHKVYAVTDSGNDGNLPENTFDNNFGSRWSSSGDGQWIQYDLGRIQSIGYVGISFLLQSARTTNFEVLVSEDGGVWEQVYSGTSNLTSTDTQLQVVDFPDTQGRYVKIIGHQNSTGPWNSITEVQIYAPCTAGNLLILPSVVPLNVNVVTDSLGSSAAANVKDNDIRTFWSATGDGQWLEYDFGSSQEIGHVGISFEQGLEKHYAFDIQTSADHTTWTTVYTGQNSVLSSEIVAYDVVDTTARYIKFIFHGNNADLANQVSEIQVYAPQAAGPVLDPLHVTKRVKGDEQLVVNGETKPAGLGWTETMSNVSYAYLEGTGGYYFPQPTSLKGTRAVSQGSWSQMNKGGPTTVLSINYLTLWLDHGTNPFYQDYAYVLLPNKTAAETASYSLNPNIEILVNNTNVQAVKEKTQGILGANFWSPSTFGYLTASNPSSILLQDQGGVLDVAVSDPTHLQAKVSYEIHRAGLSVIEKDPSISILQLSPTIKFEVNTQAGDGKSHKLKLQINTAVQAPLPTPTAPPIHVVEPVPDTIVDVLDDLSLTFAHSANLTFDRGQPEAFDGDTSRLIRKTVTNEYLIYKAQPNKDITGFTAKAWFWPNEAVTDFAFYTSPDNVTYTAFAPTKVEGIHGYKEVDYSGMLPSGTQFLKLVYMHNGSYNWNPQLGEVTLTSKVPPPTSITVVDNVYDDTKMFERSANLTITGSNPQSFGDDASRLVRLTNTDEYIVYKAEPTMELRNFVADMWFWPYETSTDFQFAVSSDNVSYVPYTPTIATVPGNWNKVTYSGTLPRGTQYLKIIYKQHSSNIWNAQIGKVTLTSKIPTPTSATVTDDVYNFSKMYDHSSQLSFDTANVAKFGGDASRLKRNANTDEWIVYKAAPEMDMKSFQMETWFWPYETSADFEVYSSPDNVTYTIFSPVKAVTASDWKKVTYSGALPAGTQFLKIVYKQHTANYWNPQIGKVQILSEVND
ncbi:polysaccharide lyase family 8 super-sandwich domain-containing protein [Paenibacillus ferrarius]|uniref:polysaccharide lyase family 8 super-sandwich domain-containing protein n=1 Tax=Paenibacillus ferrarius TaxID=1469647 RepID=UPI003D27851E